MGITMTKVTGPEDLIWHQPLDGADLEVVDGHDKQLPDGTAGVVRIRIRGNGLSQYFRDPDATAKAFRHGYFYPGDMAMRRADGRIRFLGRVADVLALGGNKVPVRPFEEQIEQRTGCQRAAVFARQMDDTREEVVVAVQTDAPLLKGAENSILSLFPPGVKVRVMTHPLFPMTAAGKVDRLTLREIAFASDASSRP
jgi:acyl-coenzyme A synthetase/AMP-(fatty) acid ligase